jgi:hypothetical protein
LLNEAVVAQNMPNEMLSKTMVYSAVTIGRDEEEKYTDIQYQQYECQYLRPYSPVFLYVSYHPEDIEIGWTRRTRDSGFLKDYVDTPLNEDSEQYLVQLFQDNALIYSQQVMHPKILIPKFELRRYKGKLNAKIGQLSMHVGLGITSTIDVYV